MKFFFKRLCNKILRLLYKPIFYCKYPSVKWLNPIKVGNFFSQDGQDFYLSSLLLNYFESNPKSWVVDVGCNHPVYFSNSYFFEKYYKCKVLAIDPLIEYEPLWRELRPEATFLNLAISSKGNKLLLNIPSGVNPDLMFSFLGPGSGKLSQETCIQRDVNAKRLDLIFSELCIEEVGLLTIDVEGAEIDVLDSINFEKVLIGCICIENNSKSIFGDKKIRNSLISKGYTYFARICYQDDIFIHQTLLKGSNAY